MLLIARAAYLAFLAFLAPDVVQKVVSGKQAVDVNIARLLAAAPPPLVREAQRRVLGFDG